MTRQMQATRRYGFETERPKSPPKGARAIAGVRVSAEGERDGDTATSAPEQREWAAWESERRGLVPVDVDAEDMSVPGGIDYADERLGLWRAIEAIEAGDADVLMFQNTKRMARDIELGAHVRRRVEAAGGWLVLGDCPDGAPQAMFGLLLGQGQDDHAEKKGYLRAAKIAATVKGVSLGKVPYGYRRGADGVLVVEETEAAAVRELFELRAAGGSWRQLAELFKARTGNARAQAALDHMMQNRKYLGEVWFEGMRTDAAHPAIVSEELFKAANARRKGGQPKSGAKALLSGIARCGTCRYGMTSTMSGAKGYRMRVYRCTGRTAGACDAPAMTNAEKVDEIVKADVWDWIEGRGHGDHVYVSSALDEERLDAARLAVAAAEAAIGLAILVVYFRNRGSIAVEDINLMKG